MNKMINGKWSIEKIICIISVLSIVTGIFTACTDIKTSNDYLIYSDELSEKKQAYISSGMTGFPEKEMNSENALANIDTLLSSENGDNITGYTGENTDEKSIKFILGDTILQNVRVNYGNVIKTFPLVDVDHDQIVVWFYKNTDIIVSAPYTVYKDVIIEARIFDNNISNVLDIQSTAPKNNTQSIMFMSLLSSLEASATGFDVTASYKENDVLSEKKWSVETNTVYSSVTVTSAGMINTIKARDYGGAYICMMYVDGVPTNIGQIDFIVKSYVVINGEKVYSDEKKFTVIDGVVSNSSTFDLIPKYDLQAEVIPNNTIKL